ncbi:MAG: ATP-grasp domain-containing protein [Deltaproteobacteria bacterium]|nr:ATP-grasp domain-containing protein [Deltaproteobacteria bacterium]
MLCDLSVSPQQYDFNYLIQQDPDWKTEKDIIRVLKKLGHNIKILVLYNNLEKLIQEIKEFKPDVVFNLTESFRNERALSSQLLGVLDLLSVPYTGATPQTLMLCNNKGMTKKMLLHHHIKTPQFKISYIKKPLRSLKSFPYPAIVKPLRAEGSEGISQSSFVRSEKECLERIQFLHTHLKMHALIEEYIDGREFYISVMGQPYYEVFSIREMTFRNIPPGDPKIATYHAKFSKEYRDKWGIRSEKARGLPESIQEEIKKIGKKVCEALQIDSYVRQDMRMTESHEIYVLEVNPNPDIAQWEDFAWSADNEGIKYPELIDRIISQGLLRTFPGKI